MDGANGAADEVAFHRADDPGKFTLLEMAARPFLVEPEEQRKRGFGPELPKTLEGLVQFRVLLGPTRDRAVVEAQVVEILGEFDARRLTDRGRWRRTP